MLGPQRPSVSLAPTEVCLAGQEPGCPLFFVSEIALGEIAGVDGLLAAGCRAAPGEVHADAVGMKSQCDKYPHCFEAPDGGKAELLGLLGLGRDAEFDTVRAVVAFDRIDDLRCMLGQHCQKIQQSLLDVGRHWDATGSPGSGEVF